MDERDFEIPNLRANLAFDALYEIDAIMRTIANHSRPSPQALDLYVIRGLAMRAQRLVSIIVSALDPPDSDLSFDDMERFVNADWDVHV